MAVVATRSNTGMVEAPLVIEKKAWFLCKFLCQNLTEENFEKVRVHVGNCKGVKTKVKLSPKGWRVGYKPSHVRHFNQKLPYETFPLEFIEDVFQDSKFINVLLCVFRLQNIPGLEFEIVAYKFTDPATTKRIEDIFQVLAGNSTGGAGRLRPTGQLNLIPGRSYPMGTLAPDRWGGSRGGGSSVEVSEVAYGWSGYTTALPYGTIVPGDVVRRRAAGGGMGSDRHTLASQSTDDPNEVNSYGSSDVVAYREVAVTVFLDKTASLPDSRAVLQFQRHRSHLVDDIPMADVACQVMATEESISARPANGHGVSSSSSRINGSTIDDDPADDGAYLFSNGVSLAYSNVRTPRQKNIAITSMDVIDGGGGGRANNARVIRGTAAPGSASFFGDDDDDEDEDMTSTVRRIYSRGHAGGQPERGRTPVSDLSGGGGRSRSAHSSSDLRLRSRSVDPLQEDFRYLTVTPRPGEFRSRQQQQQPLDLVSVRSQSSYYLDPNFTKVYAPRRNQHVKYSVYAPSSVSGSRVYSDRDLVRTRRY